MDIKHSFYVTVPQSFDVKRFENVACNLCGGTEFKLLMQELDFDIRVCKSCELVYVSPQPIEDELPRFYDEFYADMSKRDIEARSLGLTVTHDDLARLVADAVAEGSLRSDLSPEVVSRLVFGTVNSLVDWYSPDGSLDPDTLAEGVADLLFRGLEA